MPGLSDNMVYDIIQPVPSAVGNTTVNASAYDVDCMLVPNPGALLNVTIQEENNTFVELADGSIIRLPCKSPGNLRLYEARLTFIKFWAL